MVFLATGGQPYYLAGTFAVLLAAGAIEADAWLQRGWRRLRAGPLAAGVGVSGVGSAVIGLPVLPAKQVGPVIAVKGDVGETIGWPQFARTVAAVYRHAGRAPVVFTSNCGEAGAVDRSDRRSDCHPPTAATTDSPSSGVHRQTRPARSWSSATRALGSPCTSKAAGSLRASATGRTSTTTRTASQSPSARETRAPWSRIWERLRRRG